MSDHENRLKLGKGVAFVKSQLKRLRQEDETWEADFRPLPKPVSQSANCYLGMVVTQPYGCIRAESEIERSPNVNDLATLLAHAMRRPLVEGYYRPSRIELRANPKWQPLFPALKEIGIEVVIKSELSKVDEAIQEFFVAVKGFHSVGKTKPSADQANVENEFPAIAKWVRGFGHIEIGDQEGFGFIVRALDYGGQVFEDDKPCTLAEAMISLEKGLVDWFKNQGVEL